VNVVIGTPIYRKGAYLAKKFLTNQKQIQDNYPLCELVFATSEYEFAEELECLVALYELKGAVLVYDVVKPAYARSNIWNIACGREEIRKYVLSKTKASYLIFLDADMTFDPSVITIMEEEIQTYDVVFSGYPLKQYGTGLAGAGCVLLTKRILERIRFRCNEFKNGEVIFEDNLLELDLFHLRCRIKKGFFLSIDHHITAIEARRINPHKVDMLKRITNCGFVRYTLIKTSVIIHYNIPWRLKVILSKFWDVVKKLRYSTQI
jgi:hypothetical protein